MVVEWVGSGSGHWAERQGEGGGGSKVGVEELHGGVVGGLEVGVVIQEEIQVRFQGLSVQMIESSQFDDVICLDSIQKRGGEGQDRVINRWLGAFSGGLRG